MEIIMSRTKKHHLGHIRISLFLVSLVIFLILCYSLKDNVTDSKFTPSTGVLEVHFIDVGQGDAILIKDEDADMLIDAGNNDQAEIVTNYLKSENITKLNYVIGTHPHSDHMGGMDTVLNTIPADRFLLPAVNYNTNTFHDVLNAIGTHKIKTKIAEVGDRYHLGDAVFTILAPNSATYDDLNNYSVCIKLVYGNVSFLLAADAEDISEEEMLTNGSDLSADVLKMGHHGSANSCTEALLNAVHPTYGVISVGKDNEHGHPSAKVMRAVLNHHIKLYRTDDQGTIIFTTDGKNISVNKAAYQITNADINK
jgi:competence protein ComEC